MRSELVNIYFLTNKKILITKVYPRPHSVFYVVSNPQSIYRFGSRFSIILYGKLSLRFASCAPLVVTADRNPPSSKLFTQYLHVYSP